MPQIAQLGLRGVQFIFSLLTLSLVGNVIAEAFAGNSSRINYAMFVSVIDMVMVLWGTAAAFSENIGFGIILKIADVVVGILTLICGIVLAAGLHVHSCGNRVCCVVNPI